MKHVKKSVLLAHSARQMFELVRDVERYPAFLPWCEKGEVLERHEDGMTARIHLGFHGVRHAFSTRNVEEPGRSVTLRLVDGPFSMLEGEWRFTPLGVPGATDAGTEPRACKIDFDLRYAFASRALQVVVAPVFDRIAATFVDAFVKRADQVYGTG